MNNPITLMSSYPLFKLLKPIQGLSSPFCKDLRNGLPNKFSHRIYHTHNLFIKKDATARDVYFIGL